ncbi:MAG: hypothetical protein NZ853_07995 [Leptospiraceae bacterium]|nr:hypothetical protein [Leptospiraceae bacterium]
MSIFFIVLSEIQQSRIHKEILISIEKRLHQKKKELSQLLVEWVDYDAPVKYFQNLYPDFIEREFLVSVRNLGLQLIATIQKDGSLKELYLFNPDGTISDIPKDLQNFFSQRNIPHLTKREEEITGFLFSEKGLIMFATRGVLWFKENYKNSHGTMVFGKVIDDRFLKQLQNDIQYNVSLEKLTDATNIKDSVELKRESLFYNEGRVYIFDYFGKPIYYLSIEFPKTYVKYNVYLLLSILVFTLIIIMVSFFLLRRDIFNKVVKRLQHLNEEINHIKNHPEDIRDLMVVNGKDEIAQLQMDFIEMMRKIKEYESLNKIYIELLEQEKNKTFKLLLNILPKPIAYRLFESHEDLIADGYNEASILFADMVNFTSWSKDLEPRELVSTLNELFTRFDKITDRYKVEKIKTIGDCYMAATGIPEYDDWHADNIVRFAMGMIGEIERMNRERGLDIMMRIGINSGRIVAGVIGTKKFIYDVWGDTVNIASRLENYGVGNQIQISEETYRKIKDERLKGLFRKRGKLQLKSGHIIDVYVMDMSKKDLVLDIN